MTNAGEYALAQKPAVPVPSNYAHYGLYLLAMTDYEAAIVLWERVNTQVLSNHNIFTEDPAQMWADERDQLEGEVSKAEELLRRHLENETTERPVQIETFWTEKMNELTNGGT